MYKITFNHKTQTWQLFSAKNDTFIRDFKHVSHAIIYAQNY